MHRLQIWAAHEAAGDAALQRCEAAPGPRDLPDKEGALLVVSRPEQDALALQHNRNPRVEVEAVSVDRSWVMIF
eukprot:8926200-Pyramimonas_sp.AAC.1